MRKPFMSMLSIALIVVTILALVLSVADAWIGPGL
jgi:hypothetical protein